MKETFVRQSRSIRYAIKELEKELVKARDLENVEWEEDILEHINNLDNALFSIELVGKWAKLVEDANG